MPLRVSKLHALLARIIGAIVQHGKEVVIETENGPPVSFLVYVSPEDVARVLGKGGDTVKAVRAILYGAGAQAGIPVSLLVVPRII